MGISPHFTGEEGKAEINDRKGVAEMWSLTSGLGLDPVQCRHTHCSKLQAEQATDRQENWYEREQCTEKFWYQGGMNLTFGLCN